MFEHITAETGIDSMQQAEGNNIRCGQTDQIALKALLRSPSVRCYRQEIQVGRYEPRGCSADCDDIENRAILRRRVLCLPREITLGALRDSDFLKKTRAFGKSDDLFS